MLNTVRTLFVILPLILMCGSAHATEWAADWVLCKQEGDVDLAFDACNRLVADGAESTFVYTRLGQIYQQKNDPIFAGLFYKKALDINPRNEEAQKGYKEVTKVPTIIEFMQKFDERWMLEQYLKSQ